MMMDGETRFQELISKGHSAAWDQDWGQAASYFEQALEEKPNNTNALKSLGLALFEMKEFEESRKYYQRVSEIDQDDPTPVEKMVLIARHLGEKKKAANLALQAAELYLKREDIQKAIQNWKLALEIDPLKIRAYARLAMVYERLGWKKRAITEYIKVASILQKTGRSEKALETVQRALNIMPENIHAIRARDMIKRGKPLPLPEQPPKMKEEEEREDPLQLQAPEEQDPEEKDTPIKESNQRSLEVLAQTVFEESLVPQKTFDAGRRDIDDLLDDGSSEEGLTGDDSLLKLHVSEAIELQTEGKTSEAAEELKKAVNLGYESAAVFYNLGYLYYQTGRLESAERNLRRSVTNTEFGLGSRLLLAKIKEEKEIWGEASKEYLEALRIADTKLAPKEERDDLLQLYEAMIDDLETEEEEEAHVQLCEHIRNLLIRKDWRRVLKDHREKAKDEPDLLPVVDELVESRRSMVVSAHRKVKELSQNGYYGAAMEKAFLALRESPTFLPLHITIGDLLLEQGEQSAAIKKYLAVADVYMVQDKLERALSLYKKIIELAPLNIDVRQRYIDLLEEYGQKDKAVHEYINLADVYYSLAELKKAHKTYQRALDLISMFSFDDEWEKTILYRMADIDAQRLDWDSALEVYKKIRDGFPKDQEASKKIIELHYRLGEERKANHEMERYMGLFDPAQEGEQILSYLESLKQENPREMDVRKNLAAFYQGQGQKQKAVAELDALGDMLLDAGDTRRAVQVVEDIISLNPPNLEDYQKLLSQLKG